MFPPSVPRDRPAGVLASSLTPRCPAGSQPWRSHAGPSEAGGELYNSVPRNIGAHRPSLVISH
eukprot:scaffold136361_cov102-Phaeocystis_antarctica.AAC.1